MASRYVVVITRSARKELEALSEPLSSRVLDRIAGLAANPRPRNVRKLRGSTDLWRMRVGDYRVIYGVQDDRRLVDVIAIRHRSDAYR